MLLLPCYGASWVLAHMAARRRLGVRSMFFLLPRALLPHLQHSLGFIKFMASRVMLNHFVQKIHWNFQSPSHGACLTSHKASNRHAGRAGEDRMGKRAHGETSAGGRQHGRTGIYCMMFLSLWRELFSHAQWVVPLNGKINVASMRISSYLVHVCSTCSKMLRACTSLFNRLRIKFSDLSWLSYCHYCRMVFDERWCKRYVK